MRNDRQVAGIQPGVSRDAPDINIREAGVGAFLVDEQRRDLHETCLHDSRLTIAVIVVRSTS
jgi:hypothetical protein